VTKVKQELHLAFVLHTRDYRETSLLVEVLSQQHGRVTVVARGAKRGKAKASSILRPFAPVQISWLGDGDLVTMLEVEELPQDSNLQAKRAICGLYLNELLIRLLPKWDACLELFNEYQTTLQALADLELNEQITLRKFEKRLLKALGYGLQLSCEVESGAPIEAHNYYVFDPILGPKLALNSATQAIKGSSLLMLANEDFNAATDLAEIRRLMRSVLAYHLGPKQLVSRQLL